jgi:hypothetical protein
MTNTYLDLFHTQHHNDIRQTISNNPLLVNLADISLVSYRQHYRGRVRVWNGRVEATTPTMEGINIWIVINYMMIHRQNQEVGLQRIEDKGFSYLTLVKRKWRPVIAITLGQYATADEIVRTTPVEWRNYQCQVHKSLRRLKISRYRNSPHHDPWGRLIIFAQQYPGIIIYW